METETTISLYSVRYHSFILAELEQSWFYIASNGR